MRSTEISQDLLRSLKIYWDLKKSTDLKFDIWHLTFDMTWLHKWLMDSEVILAIEKKSDWTIKVY